MMELSTHFSVRTPLHLRIADELKRQILSGALTTGEQLPSENALAALFGASRMTVRKGLQVLTDQHLVSSRRGLGTFVIHRREKSRRRIGILKSSLSGSYGLSIFSGLMNHLTRSSQCGVSIIDDQTSPDALLSAMLEARCDGLIAIAPTRVIIQELASPAFDAAPMVVIGVNAPELRRGRRGVVASAADAVRRGVEYLHGLGHRKIGYISSSLEDYTLPERNRSFLEAMETLGLSPDEGHFVVMRPEEGRFAGGARYARELCRSDNPPDALLLPGAGFAYGAWQGVLESGWRPGREISLLGFDCDSHCNPFFSSVEQPAEQIAEEAVKLLLDALDFGKNNSESPLLLSAAIRERGSCRPIDEQLACRKMKINLQPKE